MSKWVNRDIDYYDYMGLKDNDEDDCYVDEEDKEDIFPLEHNEEEYVEESINQPNKKLKNRKNVYSRIRRTIKGHLVRSNFEKKFANYMYNRRIRYVYEPKLRLGKNLFKPDFYLPDKKVYIECWGMNNMAAYMAKRIYKEKRYKLYHISYLSVNYRDMINGKFNKILKRAGII